MFLDGGQYPLEWLVVYFQCVHYISYKNHASETKENKLPTLLSKFCIKPITNAVWNFSEKEAEFLITHQNEGKVISF